MTGEKLRKVRKWLITGVIFTSACCALVSFFKSVQLKENNESGMGKVFGRKIGRQIEKAYFMLPAFLDNGETESSLVGMLKQAVIEEIPVYSYTFAYEEKDETQDDTMAELIRRQEGSDEDNKEIEESSLDYGEDALHIENSMIEEMQKENSRYQEESEEDNNNAEEVQEETGEEEAGEQPAGFQRAQYPAYTYDWSEQWGYEELVANFYAIDNSTSLKEEYMDLDELLYQDLSLNQVSDGPQILIYHTHSQEAFADSVPGDASTTIVGAGAKLARLLQEEYGFRVMHHTGEYDVEKRDDAYSNSLPALEEILAENPTIEVVIDVHRDEMKEGKKLVMDVQGRPTARFMFFNGMSCIRNKGDISYLENPYIQDNLAFSFQAQVAANEYYPGIARRIYLKAYRYNLHLKPKSMLIELGAQTNTVEEIMNACDPLAHIIAIVLGGEM